MLPSAWSSFGIASKWRVEVVVEFVCVSRVVGRACVSKSSVWSSLLSSLCARIEFVMEFACDSRVCGRVCD